MKNFAVLAAILATGVVVNVLIATSGHSAEDQREKQLLDATAVMRLDAGPLVEKLGRLESEMLQMRQTMIAMSAKIDSLQENVKEAAEALSTLQRPEQWMYHIQRNTSSYAADQLGKEGWELIGGTDNMLFYRKPAPAQGVE